MNSTLIISFAILFGLVIGHISTEKGNKSQAVRLMDVYFLGPLLIYVGIIIFNNSTIKYNFLIGLLTIFFGASTITYNLRNYLKTRKLREAENSN